MSGVSGPTAGVFGQGVTDGALYCDKCKQRPAHIPTVFSQAQTTPAAMFCFFSEQPTVHGDPAPCVAVGVVHGRAPSPQLSIQGFSARTLWPPSDASAGQTVGWMELYDESSPVA